MQKLIANKYRVDFTFELNQTAARGFTVIPGTIYAVGLSRKREQFFSITLWKEGRDLTLTAEDFGTFMRIVAQRLDEGYTIVPGTLYAADLKLKIGVEELLGEPWRSDVYKKWGEIEIKEYWEENTLDKYIDLSKEENLVIVHIDLPSAIVMAAIWMRYVLDMIEYTYYDTNKEVLYLYYGSKQFPGANIDRKVLIEQAGKRTRDIVKKCFVVSYMGSRKVDFDQLPLFKRKSEMEASDYD
jgi:hypothetical protein